MFELEAVSLVSINKIRIGHDGTGPGMPFYVFSFFLLMRVQTIC